MCENIVLHVSIEFDHAFVLSSVISSRMDQNKPTFVAFIDFAKAFDWVDRELLLYKLLRSSVDGPFYFAIKSMYTKTRSSVKVNDDLSNWFETECGVRQGDVLSPTLFNIFINDLSTELYSLRIGITLGDDRISHLLYADDLTLMAENENDLQTLINCVENWCNKWRMSVNHLKSKIVHFRKVRVSITDFSFTFQNKTVDIVQKYKYLGLILEEHLDFKASINELCSKGGRALGACISKFKTLKDVGYITYKKLFDCTVVPIIDYFAGVWGHTKHDDCSKLQNRALRYFLGVGPKTPIPALHGEVNWVSPFSRHVACITKLWNRTIMMNEQRLPLKVLKYTRNNNLGWVKRVKSIFLELDLDITSNDISHIPLQTVKEHLVIKDTHQWKLSVASKPKLRTYALFKKNLKTELYVSLSIPKCKRSIFCQFRSGILPLAIETGRYRNVPADERLCEICNLNQVEDEIHFLCFCPRYQESRTELYQNVLYQNDL